METKTATIGIRGTIVTGEITENGDIIGCPQGVIEVMSLTDGTRVIVRAGEQTFVQEGSPPQTPTEIKEGGQTGGTPEDTPPSADDARQTNLQDSTLKDINDKVNTSGCPIGSVGTAPNCQTINTSYQTPAYWTATLSEPSTQEIKILEGYSVSAYKKLENSVYNTYLTHGGTLKITLDGRSETTGALSDNQFYLTNNNDEVYNLTVGLIDPSAFTYKNINEFSIQGFDSYPNSWIQSEKTVTNEYVSWGYWQYDLSSYSEGPLPFSADLLLPWLNFWVAGVDAEAAKNHILTLAPTASYDYTGKSIGYIYDSDLNTYTGIDAVNNNTVFLKFDFGSETPLNASSYIQFQTNGTAPEVWKFDNLSGSLAVSGTSKVFDATSTIKINGALVEDTQAQVKGTFYGNQAQAVGGSFKAPTGNKTAIGVFKAVR